MSGATVVTLLAAVAGGLLVASARDVMAATPALVRWMRRALEPLGRSAREGYAPTADERRRLALLAVGGLAAAGALVFGPGTAPVLGLAGPAAAAVAIGRRRAAYRREVEAGLQSVALAIADALAGGRSLRAALADAAAAAEGPAGAELARVRADLELGRPTAAALRGLARRVPSARVEAFRAALLSQRIAGGDLASLMRTFAAAAAEHDRAVADARSATAQARFTGILVAAMPVGAALFAELIEPGFLAAILTQTASALLLCLAAVLQVIGFAAIARLSRVWAP